MGERRNLGQAPFQVVGEPSEEVADLVWVEAAEPYGEVRAADVLRTGPGTR
jgi:hypothetical protein